MPPLKISKNCYAGVLVKDIRQLADLARHQKSVIIAYGHGPRSGDLIKPANWLMGLPARVIHNYIEQNQMYFCVKKEDFDLIDP